MSIDQGSNPTPTYFFFPIHWSAISQELLSRLPSGLHRCADILRLHKRRSLCTLSNIFVDSAVRKGVFARTFVRSSWITDSQVADRLLIIMFNELCIICVSVGPLPV